MKNKIYEMTQSLLKLTDQSELGWSIMIIEIFIK